jgi:predicted DCC family thiol-disulfide oxidoreductase YuxK
MKPLILFFDGSCHLCSREIQHYAKIAPEGVLEYVNIADPDFDAEAVGLDPTKVEKFFHVQLPSGEIRQGLEAFIAIWEALPQYRKLAIVARLPVIYQAMGLGYRCFALVRPLLPKKTGVCPLPSKVKKQEAFFKDF